LVLENLIPAIFSLLLALIVMLLSRPLHAMMYNASELVGETITWRVTLWAVLLGAILFWLQLVL
jgi:hypothetical protein